MQAVRGRIHTATSAAGRCTGAVQLLAVSKTRSVDDIRAAAAAGQRCFGENYVQEGVHKIIALQGLALEWHFIGPLQSNKTKQVAEYFDWVHSIERFKIAQRLAQQRPSALAPLQLCIQVNIGGEATKSGVAPDQVAALAQQIDTLSGVRLRGLMIIPEADAAPTVLAQRFMALRQLKEALCDQGFQLDTLSMGMSNDLEIAVAAGSTMVRIGTAIFGQRPAIKGAQPI